MLREFKKGVPYPDWVDLGRGKDQENLPGLIEFGSKE